MKKVLLTVAITTMIATLSFSQEDHIGIKGGINLTTMKFTFNGTSISPDRAVKPHFGIYFNRMISDNVAIQPEFLYHVVGYKPEAGSPVDDITLSYIAIPVMFKYYASENFNIHAGPQLGILVGGTEFNGVSITEGTKSTEISFGFGVEAELSQNIGLSARYVAGISNTDDSGDDDFEQKSNTIQLSLLVRLN